VTEVVNAPGTCSVRVDGGLLVSMLSMLPVGVCIMGPFSLAGCMMDGGWMHTDVARHTNYCLNHPSTLMYVRTYCRSHTSIHTYTHAVIGLMS